MYNTIQYHTTLLYSCLLNTPYANPPHIKIKWINDEQENAVISPVSLYTMSHTMKNIPTTATKREKNITNWAEGLSNGT